MSNGLSVPVERAEVTALFATWLADKALVRIEFRFRAFAATFLARVTRASESELRFISDDRWAELALPLPDDIIFRYLDLRGTPKGQKFERLIVLFYPFVSDPDESDQIAFAEVIEPHQKING